MGLISLIYKELSKLERQRAKKWRMIRTNTHTHTQSKVSLKHINSGQTQNLGNAN